MCGFFDEARSLVSDSSAAGAAKAPSPRAAAIRAPLIVEEKPICGHALAGLLAGVGVEARPRRAASFEEALEHAERAPVDILLVDLFTIGYDFDGLRRLTETTGAPTVAIDDRPNPTFAGLARLAGARGYASKNYEMDGFYAVIRSVCEGGEHFPPDTAMRRGGAAHRASGLSPRQLDVLKCIAVGMSNQEVARTLGISLGTVKLHIHAILRLTGTRNRTEAALIAGRFLAPAIAG